MKKKIDYAKLKTRPPLAQRLFRSEAVEQAILSVGAKIQDKNVRRMFTQCLPNTLDTTAHYYEAKKGVPDTFIATGDIPAMWLRDSTNQVWRYLRFVNQD